MWEWLYLVSVFIGINKVSKLYLLLGLGFSFFSFPVFAQDGQEGSQEEAYPNVGSAKTVRPGSYGGVHILSPSKQLDGSDSNNEDGHVGSLHVLTKNYNSGNVHLLDPSDGVLSDQQGFTVQRTIQDPSLLPKNDEDATPP